jgi:hypothetical protein
LFLDTKAKLFSFESLVKKLWKIATIRAVIAMARYGKQLHWFCKDFSVFS